MKSRRERRAEAREQGVPFEPQYNSVTKVDSKGNTYTAGKVMTYEEMYGVGYERFNNKFVTIKEVDKKSNSEA